MMRILFLTTVLVSASAMSISNLRGAPEKKEVKTEEKQEKNKETKSENNSTMLNPVEVDERGPRGHFYYAQTCADCVYKGDQCGCEPAVEYFACITKHCHDATSAPFADKCAALGNKCYKDISIDCHGSETVCESKSNQLPTGGLGFNLDIDGDDAYCGPHGKCIGKIKMKVHIQNGPKSEKKGKAPKASKSIFARKGDASPGPASAASPTPGAAQLTKDAAAPAPAPATKNDDEQSEEKVEIWLECGLPKKDHANIDNRQDWSLCQKKVKGEKEKCKIPMFPELQAGDNKEAYCVLTEGKDGKRLTQPHWSKIINVHEPAATTAAVAKKAEEPKADAQKPEKPKPTTAPKKEEKPKVTEAPLVMGNIQRLPWMVDKEERASARKAEAAKDAKEEDDDDKDEAEKKAPEPPAKDESGLPWMADKAERAKAKHAAAHGKEDDDEEDDEEEDDEKEDKEEDDEKDDEEEDAKNDEVDDKGEDDEEDEEDEEEEKAEKKEEKAEEKEEKAEKKEEKAEKKEAAKPADGAEHESGLPWMADKQSRAEAKQTADAKKAKDAKKEKVEEKAEKAEKKEADKPKEHPSGLPWMAGK